VQTRVFSPFLLTAFLSAAGTGPIALNNQEYFSGHRFRNVEALVYYARAIGAAPSGDVVAARRSTDEIAAIRMAMPATRDYNWSGSIGAQWEAAIVDGGPSFWSTMPMTMRCAPRRPTGTCRAVRSWQQ
jgi:hypothetical protein